MKLKQVLSILSAFVLLCNASPALSGVNFGSNPKVEAKKPESPETKPKEPAMDYERMLSNAIIIAEGFKNEAKRLRSESENLRKQTEELINRDKLIHSYTDSLLENQKLQSENSELAATRSTLTFAWLSSLALMALTIGAALFLKIKLVQRNKKLEDLERRISVRNGEILSLKERLGETIPRPEFDEPEYTL